jgi:hypothetical protein
MQPTLILFGIGVLVLVIGIAIARLFAMSNDRFRRADAAVKAFWRQLNVCFLDSLVESCGFEQQHVVLFEENHISGTGESCEVGNPVTLGGCDFLSSVVVCGRKAPKSICQQASPGSFDSAP